MANVQNLRPGEHKLSKEEASKGGKNSVASRRRKKNLFEITRMVLELGVVDKKQRTKLESMGINPDDLTNNAALAVSMLDKAMRGDVQAAKLIAEWGAVNAPQKDEQEVDPLSAAFEQIGMEENGK